MKVTVRINEFKRMLEEAVFLIPKVPPMPILEFVKIDVHGTQAKMSAADLGFSIVQPFEVVDSDADGSFLLHAKKMSQFLKRHVGGTAVIETTSDDKHNIVTAGTFTMKISTAIGCGVSDFPERGSMPELSHAVSLKFLKKLVEQVKSACPDKEHKHAIASVRLESDGTKLRAVASDGFRIAIADAPGNWGVFNLLLPKTSLPLLKRRQGPMARIAQSEISFFVETDSALLQCAKPTTRFPNYEKALIQQESEWKSTVKVASEDLKSAIFNVLSTANEKRPAILFTVCADNLQLRIAHSEEITTGCIPALTEGERDFTVKLNPALVLPFLSYAGEEVTIQFPSSEKFFVRFSAGNEYQYLVMPLKLRQEEEPVSECASSAT